MKKIKVTGDAVLSIIMGIFADENINSVIENGEWQGKTLQEVLNVEYYTFKHRPEKSEKIIEQKINAGDIDVDMMLSLARSFCLVSLGDTERLFSKDVDMLTASANMEYAIQTSKVKILESLIENCNLALCGVRIPVKFGEENRQAIVIFEHPIVSDIQTNSAYGEIAVIDVGVSMLLYPDVVSYSDYSVEFEYMDGEEQEQSGAIPLSSIAFINTMTQKSVPYAQNTTKVGSINLSCANSFVLVMDGYNNAFINYIVDKALSDKGDTDNNQTYLMTLKRKGKPYTHEVVIKDHQVTVNADTGNETHTLNLVTRGI